MLVCWSVGGGVGTSVVVAGLALAAVRTGEQSLVVDLCGDQPTLFGTPEPASLGLADWLAAAPDVPADALRHLEADLAPGIALLPQGGGPLAVPRVPSLLDALRADVRFVAVDAGLISQVPATERLVAEADRTLLVVRACPITLRRLERLPVLPTGIVVVRERRRSVSWQEVATAAGAPVVARRQ